MNYKSLLALTFVFFSFLSFTIHVVDINGELSLAMLLNRLLLFANCLLSLLYFVKSFSNKSLNLILERKYLIILTFYFLILLSSLRIVKVPDIDVYDVLRFGPLRILSLNNPYVSPATNSDLSVEEVGYNFYAYGPSTIFLFLPFDLILKDPRFLLILSSFISVYCIYTLSKKSGQVSETAQLLSLIFLATPRYMDFLQNSITDILIISILLTALVFLLKGRNIIFFILLSVAVGVKIFYLLPYLFLFVNKKLFKLKFMFIFALSTILIYAPFAIFNFEAFYKSMILLNTSSQAYLYKTGLTLANIFDRQFNIFINNNIATVLVLTSSILLWLIIPKTVSLSKTMLTVAFCFLIFIFLGPIASSNYFFNASSLILVSLALINNKKDEI